jgi:hypothetical protein
MPVPTVGVEPSLLPCPGGPVSVSGLVGLPCGFTIPSGVPWGCLLISPLDEANAEDEVAARSAAIDSSTNSAALVTFEPLVLVLLII